MIKSLCPKSISLSKKKIYTACLIFLFIFFSLDVRLWASSQKLDLSFLTKDKWQFEGTGRYQGWTDRRDLFTLFHPWYPTETGKYAAVTHQVQLPPDFKMPVRLHFYMTDDYDGHAKTSGWETRTSFVGHRFKQVLINDKVIWEKDVADKEGKSQPSRFSILLPDSVKGGDRINLSFRLIDKIPTSQNLPGDFFEKGIAKDSDKIYKFKFMTHLYIADVVLTPQNIEMVEPGESPINQVVRNIYKKHQPLKPYGENIKFPVELSWENWENLVYLTCPIRCGIPLPAGKVRNCNQIVLRNMKDQQLAIQTKPMNYWPDGSIRWLELDTIAESHIHTRKLMLDINNTESQPFLPNQPACVTSQNQNQITIKTGQIEITTGGNNQFINKITNGSATSQNLIGQIQIDGKIYHPIIEKTKVLANGPVRAEIEMSGDLKSKNDRIGRFVFRLCAFAGQPYLRMTWRIFNETPKTLNISRFELIGSYKPDPNNTIYWGHHKKNAKNGITVQQLLEDQYQVFDKHEKIIYTGEHAPGWLGITGDKKSLLVQVRHFYQQFPKALQFKDGKLRISLFESSKSQPHYKITEGEAKRHEIWLALWDRKVRDEQLEKNAKCFTRPPRLFDADYFCNSGGFGHAAPYDENRFGGYFAEMKYRYPNIAAEELYEFGIRNWGDKSSRKGKPTKISWKNAHYDRQRSLVNEYLMTGDLRWFDRLEAVVRHIIDVDICHFSKTRPQFVGGIYDCHRGSGDHTGGEPWEPTQRNKGTLDYWRLTGDTDARDAAIGVADFAIRENRALGARSVRNHAGIFYCLTAAYDETLDAKYLKAARRLLDDILKNRIDPRRGCYAEVHGNVSYRGNIPWMVVQLAEPVYYYYRQSGDIDAAITLVGMAESLITENASRTNPGLLHGYSSNPHFCGPDDDYSASYHSLIAATILYAYELTGDTEFLIRGQAMYKQMIKDRKVRSLGDAGWNTPTLFYYLNKYKNK